VVQNVGDICFFSGSGSSFAIAKHLAEDLQCRLVPIVRGRGIESISDGEILGFVFPVYHASYGGSGVPDIVARFVSSIGPLNEKYVFAVCTHSGMPCTTIDNFSSLVERHGGALSIGTAVKMNVPYSTFQKMQHVLFQKKLCVDKATEAALRSDLYANWERKREALVASIRNRRRDQVERSSTIGRILFRLLAAVQKKAIAQRYQELSGIDGGDLHETLRAADRSFELSESCNGCGLCSEICPVDNIVMVNGRPQWQHDCELCFACFQWCPQRAIVGKIFDFEKRYHHPEIGIADMVKRKRNTPAVEESS
jgi:ferredoxin